MSINRRGKWWKGTEFADVAEYLRELQPGGYAVDEVRQSVCACGGRQFRILVDREDELAKRICVECAAEQFIADSGDFWAEADPEPVRCSCRKNIFEIGVGFAFGGRDWVRWMSVGLRCTKCGILGSPFDWKADYDKSDPVIRNI
jgi:hypothetical protein